MGSLRQVSVASGSRVNVPADLLQKYFEKQLQDDQLSEELALCYEDETCKARITYGELNCLANRLARSIVQLTKTSHPNSDGDYIVAVCMKPSHCTVATLLATWKAGAAYVPMETTFPQGRIDRILGDSKPVLVVYDSSANPQMFKNSGVPLISYEELCEESWNHLSENLDDTEILHQVHSPIALVLYTSGSTGIPKGVRISHAAVCNRLWWQYEKFPFASSERFCSWKTALTFVDAVCEMWGPLLQGRTLVVLSKEVTRDPQRLVAALTENQIQRLVLVPTLLRSILMYLSLKPSERPLKCLKLWVCSGETLTKDLAGQFFKYFGSGAGYKLANFYGSTEVMGDVTYFVMESAVHLDLFPTIPIGYPLNNCCVYLLDAELAPVPTGEVGEIWVSGANLAAGYVGGQAPDKFRDNPHATHLDYRRLYRTGDFGILDRSFNEKGVVLYAGRTDSQVKVRGHRVDLQEVDSAVSAVKGVDKSVVLCYGADTGSPEILAFITLRDDARISEHKVEAELKNALTDYMIPQVIVMESIPLLINGKVDRQALFKSYENTNNNDDSAIAIEFDYSGVSSEDRQKAEVLFTTIGDVLGRAARGAVSLRANFYQLGGNSLNSIYTITKLRDQGYYIEISDFLGAESLGEILSLMRTSQCCDTEPKDKKTFIAEPLAEQHKDYVIEMIISSFYEKADLEQWIKDEIQPRDYADCICACWKALISARLSVVLREGSGEYVAVALNFDARQEPDIELTGGIAKIMEFLEFVEGPVRETLLPKGEGTVLHSFMMATAERLSASDNVRAIRELENATLNVARARAFKGVFTTNTSPLTQQLGRDVLGFQTLLDYQVNQYVDSAGVRVFGRAPDDQRAIVCWKPIDYTMN